MARGGARDIGVGQCLLPKLRFAGVDIGEKLLVVDRHAWVLDWLSLPAAEAFAALRVLIETLVECPDYTGPVLQGL